MPASTQSIDGTVPTCTDRLKRKTIKTPTMASDPLSEAATIIENRLFYKAFPSDPKGFGNYTTLTSNNGKPGAKQRIHYFSIDAELVYWNFFLDFGPLNLGQLYRFCEKLNCKVNDSRLANRAICFYSNSSFEKRANAIYLIGAWQVIYLNRSPEEACGAFINSIDREYESRQAQSPRSVVLKGNTFASVPPFHDASPCECSYDVTILDCLRGLAKARMYNFFNFNDFNIKEYEWFEQVENGDLNWIIKDKILAFAGPQYQRQVTREGCYTLTPSDYIPYFQRRNVGLVVRLNKKQYEENEFLAAGIDHFEQYYLDGSCPSYSILQKVVSAFETVPANKGFAVHCKAGLGRTGTCIGAYIMKHYKFTAKEVIGWMRICRPGMVIGPQQHYLQDVEQKMWYEGEIMRMRPSHSIIAQTSDRDNNNIIPGIKDLSVGERQYYGSDSDAVKGRKGQADELLQRRAQQGNQDDQRH